ncbi:MAG TPA: lactonase family protein [Pilimelia sp.]|nr:lactonase family protein [Pilimelia sp.]
MDTTRRWFLGALGGAAGAALLGAPAEAAGARPAGGLRQRRLYLGSWGHGIRTAELDPATGLPARLAPGADSPDPSYLALAPGGRTLYAANELAEGTISAFAVARGGGLRPLGATPTGGVHPVYVHAHPNGRYVLSANYTSGSVSVLPVLPGGGLGAPTDVAQHTGSGPDPQRQQGPHPHKVLTDPAARFVHAVDLGADAVVSYRLRRGRLERVGAARMHPGAGPRHLAFDPRGRAAYVANELDGTLTVLRYDAGCGRLTPHQTLPAAPAGDVRNYPGEVVVSPDGRFVYVSNRGPNTIGIFAAGRDGLTPVGSVPSGGNWPRHIALDGAGTLLYVANQISGDVTTLRVNRRTGGLSPAGPALAVPTPTMVLPA